MLIAVFPPTELSVAASSVVGTWINFIPRIYVDAENPAKSPITPPPIAIIASFRVNFLESAKFKIFV